MMFRQENRISEYYSGPITETPGEMTPATEIMGVAVGTALIGTFIAKNKVKGAVIGGVAGLGIVLIYRDVIAPYLARQGLVI